MFNTACSTSPFSSFLLNCPHHRGADSELTFNCNVDPPVNGDWSRKDPAGAEDMNSKPFFVSIAWLTSLPLIIYIELKTEKNHFEKI